MSSGQKAVAEDEEEYERLCKLYGEKVMYDGHGSDCYGEHARSLKKRRRENTERNTDNTGAMAAAYFATPGAGAAIEKVFPAPRKSRAIEMTLAQKRMLCALVDAVDVLIVNDEHRQDVERGGRALYAEQLRVNHYRDRRRQLTEHRNALRALYTNITGRDPWKDLPL